VIVHIVVMFCGLLFSPQQSVDVVVPGSALNPAGQFVQADAELLENVSAGHVEHNAGPETLLAAPAAHATHGPTSGPEYPGLQEQALTLVLPNDEFAFVVQLLHAALPFVGLYVPDWHIAHCPLETPLSAPVYPVLHEHRFSVFVKSTPWSMALVIAVVVSVSRYSSTTNKPAMSALKVLSPRKLLLAM
jgi:hypothetical protein